MQPVCVSETLTCSPAGTHWCHAKSDCCVYTGRYTCSCACTYLGHTEQSPAPHLHVIYVRTPGHSPDCFMLCDPVVCTKALLFFLIPECTNCCRACTEMHIYALSHALPPVSLTKAPLDPLTYSYFSCRVCTGMHTNALSHALHTRVPHQSRVPQIFPDACHCPFCAWTCMHSHERRTTDLLARRVRHVLCVSCAQEGRAAQDYMRKPR